MKAAPVSLCLTCLLLTILLAALLVICLGLGTVSVPMANVLHWLAGGKLEGVQAVILSDLRLPRLLLAALMGCSLGVSGAVLQGVLRNPLAEPFILGVSGGAAAGAVLSMGMGLAGAWPRSALAFAGAAGTVLLVLALSRRQGRRDSATIVLTGVMINAFFTALIMYVISTVSENKMHAIMFWLYGDLGAVGMEQVRILTPVVFAGSLALALFARHLNLLAAGETTAASLGVTAERIRLILFLVVRLLGGCAVRLPGVVGFVGLMVPHLMRITLGHDHRLLLPASGLFGASFLLLADTVARTVISPAQLPVGVVTAALGAPFFVMLLAKRGSQWW